MKEVQPDLGMGQPFGMRCCPISATTCSMLIPFTLAQTGHSQILPPFCTNGVIKSESGSSPSAIKLTPTLAAEHCGFGDSLAYEGRYEESIKCFDKAIALSPNDPQFCVFYTCGALVQLFKRDFSAALQWAERASSIPNYQYWSTAHKMIAHAYLGNQA